MTSKRGLKSAPILYTLPDAFFDVSWPGERMHPRYAPAPAWAEASVVPEHAVFVQTGQLFHLFVDRDYIDTFLSPDISNLFESQARELCAGARIVDIARRSA